MALQGSLSDFGIADILQLIGSQHKTGVLRVEGDSGGDEEQVAVYFSSGRIIRCDVARRDKRDLIGRLLLAAEVIDKDQLSAALKAQKKTLMRVGDLLVEQGAIDRQVLQSFTDLQTREALYRLFEWKSGTYRFEGKPPNFEKATIDPIASETILMEGFRMLDEWPLIRAKINNYGTVYRVLKEPEDLESEAEALERILDDAFSEFVDASSSGGGPAGSGEAGKLSRSERTVLRLVDGKRDVHTLVARSRLGEFETCKALLNLLNDGYVAPVRARRAVVDAPPGRRRTSWKQTAARLGVNIAALGAIVAVWLFMPRSRVELKQNAAQVAAEARDRVRANRVAALDNALEVFQLERGHYPQALNALVEADLVEAELLDPPGDQPFDYLSIGTDYVLR